MRFKSLAAVAALAAGSLFTSVANAGTVSADWLNIDPKLNVGISVTNFHGFSYSGTVQTGVNNWKVTDSTSDLFAKNQVIDAFCIEIYQHLKDPTVFTVGSLDNAPDPDYPAGGELGMGSTKANYLRELWGEFFDDIHVGTAAQQNLKGAAFQLAVWNIVYDSDFTTDSGTFRATNSTDARNKADEWLEFIRDNNGAMANLVALTNPNNQDMVTFHMPTPAAAGMGLSCLGLALMRRRRRA